MGGPRQKGANRIKSDRNVSEINDGEATKSKATQTPVFGVMESRVEVAVEGLYTESKTIRRDLSFIFT